MSLFCFVFKSTFVLLFLDTFTGDRATRHCAAHIRFAKSQGMRNEADRATMLDQNIQSLSLQEIFASSEGSSVPSVSVKMSKQNKKNCKDADRAGRQIWDDFRKCCRFG